ncbi:MAG TPA: cation:proton antiporter [Gaiellaceae bacterium]|nr:cation:proton antiporter [Gaiellaceae bacterium]
MPLAELGLFHQTAFLLLAAALAGLLALRLRQPLVTLFIAVGILAGPSGVGIVEATEQLELLATIGIALLLFVVGLKLDVRLVRTIGAGVVAAALVQMTLSGGAGFVLGRAFGLGNLEAFYLALALALSSTVIVVKLLSDRDEIDQLHGRLAVGILIVQDLAVIVAMIVLTALDSGGGVEAQLTRVLGGGALFLAAVVVATRFVLPPLLHRLAHAQELLVLFAVAWALSLAACADLLDLSKEVGAFLAGVSLASSTYREAIGGRLVSVRDFLLLFFFLNLGAALDIRSLDLRLGALAAACAVVVVLLKPIVTTLPLVLAGYGTRPSVRTGVVLAQVSEFSLILVALGLTLGHVGPDLATVVAVIAVVTITTTSYVTGAADTVAQRVARPLGLLARAHALGEGAPDRRRAPEVVVVGLGRYGGGIMEHARAAGHEVLGVDLDPRRLELLRGRGVAVLYGDAEDPDLPRRLPLADARWVISTLRRPEADLALVRALRHYGFRGGIAVAAHSRDDMELLADAGADEILTPFVDAAAAAAASVFGPSCTPSTGVLDEERAQQLR